MKSSKLSLFAVMVIAMTLAFSASATTEPVVNTNIVNADKAVFIGGILVANTSSGAIEQLRPVLIPVNTGFKTYADCKTFRDDVAAWKFTTDAATTALSLHTGGDATKLNAASIFTSWQQFGYVGLLGKCYYK